MTEPWRSADGIAAHLGATTDTVHTWIAEKGMPAHQLGRLCKFEVDEWGGNDGAAEAPPGAAPR